MTIIHHPDDATLLSYAAGSLGEALSAVVASHVALCPRCAREVRAMERVGASLIDTLKPATISATQLAVDRAPDAPAARPGATARAAATGATGDIPAPLRAIVGSDLDRVPWKRLGPGVWHHPLPLSAGSKGDLRLLKVAAGRAMPEHGHGGAELTLLLRGAYTDEVGTFRRGDVADLDDEVEHRPIADPQEGCICLIASEERARFRGVFARLFQPLTGL